MALINGRLADAGDAADCNAIGERNPDLFDKEIATRHYGRAQLMSDKARRVFVLPTHAPRARRR